MQCLCGRKSRLVRKVSQVIAINYHRYFFLFLPFYRKFLDGEKGKQGWRLSFSYLIWFNNATSYIVNSVLIFFATYSPSRLAQTQQNPYIKLSGLNFRENSINLSNGLREFLRRGSVAVEVTPVQWWRTIFARWYIIAQLSWFWSCMYQLCWTQLRHRKLMVLTT